MKLLGRDGGDEGPYFFFRLRRRGPGGVRECEVDVPPIDPDRLRNSLVRFYVDGNSWMWKFAVRFVRDALMPACPVCEGEGKDESTARVISHDAHGPIVDMDPCPHCLGDGVVSDEEFEQLQLVPKPKRPRDIPENATIMLRL